MQVLAFFHVDASIGLSDAQVDEASGARISHLASLALGTLIQLHLFFSRPYSGSSAPFLTSETWQWHGLTVFGHLCTAG